MQEISLKPMNTEIVGKASSGASLLLSRAKEIMIKHPNDYAIASDFLKGIKGESKTLESLRKTFSIPLDQLKRSVQGLFSPPKTNLAEAERIVKSKMIEWDDEQEKIRLKAEAKLREEARKQEEREKAKLEKKAEKAEEKGNTEKADELREQADSTVVVAPTLAPQEKTAGQSFRYKYWAVEVDKSKVPSQYLEINFPKVNKIAQVMKEDFNIAGLELRKEKILSSRAI